MCCRIADDAEDGLQTVKRDEKWKLTLQVLEGEHSGRTVKDSLSFGSPAVKRVASLIRALKIDGRNGLFPDMIRGKVVVAEVTEYRAYVDKKDRAQKVAVIGWNGYSAADPAVVDRLEGRSAVLRGLANGRIVSPVVHLLQAGRFPNVE